MNMGIYWKFLCFCIFANCIIDVTRSEPACSQFHFVEQILEKLVRMEFDVKQMMQDSKVAIAEINNELKRTKEDMDLLKTEWANQTKALQTLQEKENTNKGAEADHLTSIPIILFRARQPTDDTPGTNEAIVYKTVLDNTGDGYDANTGIFTATMNGLYTFSVHMCVYYNKYLPYAIVKNSDDLVRGVIDGRGGSLFYPCSSATIFTYLEKGDRVWVKCTLGGSTTQLYLINVNYYWNTFSGVLIHK